MSDAYATLAARLGGALIGRRPLKGGVSADVQALDIRRPGGAVETVVVRQHHLTGPHAVSPDVTRAEFRLLTDLSARGFAVARPILLDDRCDLLPGPFVVLAFVEGSTELTPAEVPSALPQMADFLTRLHRLDPDFAPSTLPTLRDPVPGALEYLPDEMTEIRQRLAAGPVRPISPTVALLHGDFWPGNLMWRDGRLAAVLDWEDAALGDPLVDVACARVELSWKHGPEVAAAFVGHYAERAGPLDDVALALWELYVAAAGLRFMPGWGLPPALEARIRRSSTRCLTDAARRVLVA